MEYSELIKLRHSCRNYSKAPIAPEILDEILEAGRIAPSAQNRQPWRYIVVTNNELIKKIALHSIVSLPNLFIKEAPVLILACGDVKSSLKFNKQDYYLVDVAISFQQMMLAGWNHGIGSCWIAAFDETSLKKLIDLPDHYRIVGLSPFGYPKSKNLYSRLISLVAGSKNRKPINEIVIYK